MTFAFWTRKLLLLVTAVGLAGAVAIVHRRANSDSAPRGAALYAEHCAACHGADLEGAPDWKSARPSGRLPAPPHDAAGHTWHHGDALLFRIVKEGTAAVVGNGYESDMPAFEGVLEDAEIRDVLAYIKSTWPERERRLQERATMAESD